MRLIQFHTQKLKYAKSVIKATTSFKQLEALASIYIIIIGQFGCLSVSWVHVIGPQGQRAAHL